MRIHALMGDVWRVLDRKPIYIYNVCIHRVREKKTDSTLGITLTNSNILLYFFRKEYHESNAKLLTQHKFASSNQCRYVTLRI